MFVVSKPNYPSLIFAVPVFWFLMVLTRIFQTKVLVSETDKHSSLLKGVNFALIYFLEQSVGLINSPYIYLRYIEAR